MKTILATYQTAHLCDSGNTVFQDARIKIEAESVSVANRFWWKHYAPTFDGKFNRVVGLVNYAVQN